MRNKTKVNTYFHCNTEYDSCWVAIVEGIQGTGETELDAIADAQSKLEEIRMQESRKNNSYYSFMGS